MSISNEDITDFSFWVDEKFYYASGTIDGACYDWQHPKSDCNEQEAKIKCGQAFKWAVDQVKTNKNQI